MLNFQLEACDDIDDTPAFATGPVKYAAEEVVCILLDPSCHQGLVCQRVKESKVFIVNTDKLCHPDDLKADDLDGWKNDGQH